MTRQQQRRRWVPGLLLLFALGLFGLSPAGDAAPVRPSAAAPASAVPSQRSVTMSILRVLILVLLSVAALYLWRMVRRDDGVQGVYGLSALLLAGVLAAVEGVTG